MSDEQKTRKSNNGEGWHIMVSSVDGKGFIPAEGRYETLHEAEKALKKSAADYDGQEVIIAKVQRRIKVKVETVKMVKFE